MGGTHHGHMLQTAQPEQRARKTLKAVMDVSVAT